MKQIVNFRLSRSIIATLALLGKRLHASKTVIVEKALKFYAKKELAHQNSVLECAGTLNEDEASAMLTAIQSNKRSKNIKVDP